MTRDTHNISIYRDVYANGKELLMYPDEILVSYTYKTLLVEGIKRIFDAGFGSGRHVRFFSSLGIETHGNEPSLEAVRFAQNLLKKDGYKAYIEQGICSKISRNSEFFDAVCCWGVLNNIVEKEELYNSMHEMIRILKPGGKIILSLTSKDDAKYSNANFLEDNLYESEYYGKRYYCRFWRKSDIKIFLKEFNLNNIKIGYVLRNVNFDIKQPVAYYTVAASKPNAIHY